MPTVDRAGQSDAVAVLRILRGFQAVGNSLGMAEKKRKDLIKNHRDPGPRPVEGAAGQGRLGGKEIANW